MQKVILGNKKLNFNKFLFLNLFNFYGLHWYSSFYLLYLSGLSKKCKGYHLLKNSLQFLNLSLKFNNKFEINLFKEFKAKVRFKKQLGTFKGLRLKLGLPSRGQRTHSNAKTSKKYIY